MDLSRKEFDVAGAVEEGATLHLVGPFDGKLLYEQKTVKGAKVDIVDKPVTITLRGMESETVRNIAKKHSRKAAKGVTLDQEAVGIETFQAVVIGWENIGDGSGPLECNPANVHKVFLEHDWIGQQVLAFAMDRTNFFTG